MAIPYDISALLIPNDPSHLGVWSEVSLVGWGSWEPILIYFDSLYLVHAHLSWSSSTATLPLYVVQLHLSLCTFLLSFSGTFEITYGQKMTASIHASIALTTFIVVLAIICGSIGACVLAEWMRVCLMPKIFPKWFAQGGTAEERQRVCVDGYTDEELGPSEPIPQAERRAAMSKFSKSVENLSAHYDALWCVDPNCTPTFPRRTASFNLIHMWHWGANASPKLEVDEFL